MTRLLSKHQMLYTPLKRQSSRIFIIIIIIIIIIID